MVWCDGFVCWFGVRVWCAGLRIGPIREEPGSEKNRGVGSYQNLEISIEE